MSWLDALSEFRPGPRPVPGGNRDGGPAVGGRHEGRAGDDFNERADWADILLPLGAVLHHESGGVRYWTRPGKDRRDGHSATTGYAEDADRLKVFTPHWPPFADGEVYSKFGAYALLNYGGDHQAAARELSRLGYGSQQPTQAPPAGSARNKPPEMGPHPADQPQSDDSSTLAPVVKISGRQRPEPLTELGFARRLVDKHGDELRYVVPWNRWLVWDGSSTLTDAVMTALGDYADAADPDLLRARTFDAHPTGVADLFGLRLALLHESDAGHRLAEGTVKRLTGGDRLKARRMREDFWSFDPSHTFVMLTNHKPGVSGTDEGIWRRLRLVPFEVIIPGPERDEDLGGKLADEAGAILAWLVAGYLDWRKNGLAEPGKVTEATQAYRAESDPLGRFISERCLCMPAMRAGSTELFKAFEKWCAAEREDPGTPTAFGNAMKAKGFESRKSNGRMQWHGIALADDDSGEGGEGLCQYSRARIAQTLKRSLPSPDLA
jgi:P4 family phage/plasmid primase-like protien